MTRRWLPVEGGRLEADITVYRPGEAAPRCGYCHLPTVEAVAKLRWRLAQRMDVSPCGGCIDRMAAAVNHQLKIGVASS